MDRLTFEGNFCDIAQCRELPCKYPDTGCSQKQVQERLKAYEDTGLEPEDVTDLMAAHGTAIGQLVEYLALAPLKNLRELVRAEKDGRLVVLPCKVGDPVYWLHIHP